MKWTVNKCDDQGNIITGYEQIMEGTKAEVENDYRYYYDDYTGPIDIEAIVETEEETVTAADRKSEVERAAKAFLHKQIIEKCGGICDNPEDYITEFAWAGNYLYASIDSLENAKIIATLEKGVVV